MKMDIVSSWFCTGFGGSIRLLKFLIAVLLLISMEGTWEEGGLIHFIRSSLAVVLMRCLWSRERSSEGVKAWRRWGKYLFVITRFLLGSFYMYTKRIGAGFKFLVFL